MEKKIDEETKHPWYRVQNIQIKIPGIMARLFGLFSSTRNCDQFPSVKTGGDPADLPTQQGDSTKTLSGTLRAYFLSDLIGNRDLETMKIE